MSEIQAQGNHNKRGGARSKKLSTRVDLTPMVDLGFLLITFFIFTTTMSAANGLNVVVPDDTPTEEINLTAEGKTLSLILGDHDVIRYYQGLNTAGSKSTNYSAGGLRTVIREKILEVQQHYGKNEAAVILIKPTDLASYRNVVTVLDEMRINDVKKYVLMEASTAEKTL
jgi:biopolymer transport protein ExbD